MTLQTTRTAHGLFTDVVPKRNVKTTAKGVIKISVSYVAADDASVATARAWKSSSGSPTSPIMMQPNPMKMGDSEGEHGTSTQ